MRLRSLLISILLCIGLAQPALALNYEKQFRGPVLHQNTISQVVNSPDRPSLDSQTQVDNWNAGNEYSGQQVKITSSVANASGSITASKTEASANADVSSVKGQEITCNVGASASSLTGQEINLKDQSGSAIINIFGLRIIPDLATAPSGSFYGIDLSKPAVGTMTDIHLQNGETISNAVDGEIDVSGNLEAPSLDLTSPLSSSNGGTGLDTSTSSGIPKVSSGTWSIDATQDDLPDGSTYKQYNPANVAITGGSIAGITDLAIADGGTGASDAASARSNLGLGSMATQNADSVSITGGSISGISDLAIADGGTGASDASTARSNLGLGSIATQNADSVSISGGSITGITDLAVSDGGTGASDAAGARSNLDAEQQDVVLDKMKTKAEVAESDADQTLTADQLVNDGIFTITPTAARTFTTDTAANVVAAMPGAQVGSNFVITIVDLAAYDVTLSGGTGCSVTGQASCNNSSMSFRAIVTNASAGSEAITFFRM